MGAFRPPLDAIIVPAKTRRKQEPGREYEQEQARSGPGPADVSVRDDDVRDARRARPASTPPCASESNLHPAHPCRAAAYVLSFLLVQCMGRVPYACGSRCNPGPCATAYRPRHCQSHACRACKDPSTALYRCAHVCIPMLYVLILLSHSFRTDTANRPSFSVTLLEDLRSISEYVLAC